MFDVQFVVPGAPIPKARPRVRHDGQVYTPSRTVEAEQRIRTYLKASHPHLKPTDADCAVWLRFYLSGTGRGDWDNYSKLVCDALNGIVWLDDRQVRKAQVDLYSAARMPRTEIVITSLPDVGRSVP